MLTVSKNGIAIIIFALSFMGASVSDTQVMTFLTNIGDAMSFILFVWHQLERSDSVAFLFKRK